MIFNIERRYHSSHLTCFTVSDRASSLFLNLRGDKDLFELPSRTVSMMSWLCFNIDIMLLFMLNFFMFDLLIASILSSNKLMASRVCWSIKDGPKIHVYMIVLLTASRLNILLETFFTYCFVNFFSRYFTWLSLRLYGDILWDLFDSFLSDFVVLFFFLNAKSDLPLTRLRV